MIVAIAIVGALALLLLLVGLLFIALSDGDDGITVGVIMTFVGFLFTIALFVLALAKH